MFVVEAPVEIIHQIEKLIHDFLWVSNMTKNRKIPLISLQNMAQEKLHGGIGLHNLAHRNKAIGGNFFWQMYTKPGSTWCQILQEKYLDNRCPS